MDPRSEWFTGEPDASKVRKSGSEGGGWKPAPRSTVPVARRHDDRQGAGRLPYFAVKCSREGGRKVDDASFWEVEGGGKGVGSEWHLRAQH